MNDQQLIDAELAGIEYHGTAGVSQACEDAVLRILLVGPPVTTARILTADRRHALLLITDIGDAIAIKSGFTSGYGGSGPTALSRVLQFLTSHDVGLDEMLVDPGLIERIDQSALTCSDLEHVERGRPLRPARWAEYIADYERQIAHDKSLWRTMPTVMPYSLLDERLVDLALQFEADPDRCLNRAYRRLEDSVRLRTGFSEIGAKLFSAAFLGDAPPLTWTSEDPGEIKGRGNLFTAVYMAYRNPRAHLEKPSNREDLAEFLIVNELFRLERSASDAVKSLATK